MKVTRRWIKMLAVTAAAAAGIVGVAGPASASPVPPRASGNLPGTWVNTNPNTRSVKQVVITPTRNGAITVDAFGACTPRLCEWGQVPAIIYGVSVSSATGSNFQSNQRFLLRGTEWSRTALLGAVTQTRFGLQLTLRELTVFEDRSGRGNYTVTETFVRRGNARTTTAGIAATGYVRGAPSALAPGAFGTWTNVNPAGGLASIRITGTSAFPVVRAFGRCTPTPCDLGSVFGISYGPSISARTGTTLLAPYVFSFKNEQLVITYSQSPAGVQRLTVAEYNEFTDRSGRSNYTMTETFRH
jgi:hypothetical protein